MNALSHPVRNEQTDVARFAEVREQSVRLIAPLSAEDCALQSMPDASPAKWHLAHTSWFFETFVLERFADRHQPFHPAFRTLFNSYYNAVGDRHPRPARGLLSRPGLDEILRYRRHVDEAVCAAAGRCAGREPEFDALVELGLNHEQQHQELILTDIKHALSQNPLKPAYHAPWPLTAVEQRNPGWLDFSGGIREIGHRRDVGAGRQGTGFAFDNEEPRHEVVLLPYQLATHPVTHGDFIAFIGDGGYRRPELWLSMGWDAVQAQGWRAPLYWERIGPDWHTFTLHGMVPVDPNAPVVHVSLFEADAYARWAGARLPTEAEWEVAAVVAAGAGDGLQGNFVESGALHPLALRAQPAPGSAAQMFGDVWEWTASAYLPYPRYRAAAGAVGEYNGKFMCNQFVLRGGSCATPRTHMRPTYRNFFPPDARWQFSGLRLARDAG